MRRYFTVSYTHLDVYKRQVEYLLGKGFTPDRDFYLAFGHDEEVRGEEGAFKISELLQSRGITFEYVLDEGGACLLYTSRCV